MTPRLLPLALLTLSVATAHAQTVTADATTTVGWTSDDAAVAATQVRLLGDLRGGIRYFIEGAWARTSDQRSDAFGSAYPYGNRVQVIEAYAERMFTPGRALLGLRAGRYRTPFGIYQASDHAYAGFLRAPLVRYDGYWALSNNFLEHGASVVAGVPRLTAEASVGIPADVGAAVRHRETDLVGRVQAFVGSAIVGISYIQTAPYMPARFARGHMTFTGADVRWMRGGIELRGEWLSGRPFDGTTTWGWYADAIAHRPFMGPVTVVARVERLDYEASAPFTRRAARQTIGGRVRIAGGLSAQVNLLRQQGLLGAGEPTSVDIGLTYAVRKP